MEVTRGERIRTTSFHEADTGGKQYFDPLKEQTLPHSQPVSDGETSSFTSEGHSISTDSEDDDSFAFEDMSRSRSHSIHEGDGSLDHEPPIFEDFADGGSGDEPDFSQGRRRSRSRYGIEDASILGVSIIGSPPPPISPLDDRSNDDLKKSSPPARTGALRETEIIALQRGVLEASIRLSDRDLEEEEEDRRLAEVERAQSTSNITASRPLTSGVKKIKLLMLGDSGVGKTSLLARWVEDTFNVSLVGTIGVDFKVKRARLGDEEIQVQIWDTAGQEKFHKITTAYYRGAHGILLVYDVTSQSSLQNISYWLGNIKRHSSNRVTVALIGNKVDMRESNGTRARSISTHDGQRAADACNVSYFETSAKTGEGVESAFTSVAQRVIQAFFPEDKVNCESSPERPQAGKNRKRISADKCTIA